MKNFEQAMDENGQEFLYLKMKFHKLSETKIQEDIFVSPQISEVI